MVGFWRAFIRVSSLGFLALFKVIIQPILSVSKFYSVTAYLTLGMLILKWQVIFRTNVCS